MASSMSGALSSRRAANGGLASSSRRAAASATAPALAPRAAAAARNAGDSFPSTSGRVGRDRCLRQPVHARSSTTASGARRPRSPSPQSTRHDVVGLGQAMVDFSAAVDDTFLAEFGVAKGGRRLVSVDERADLLAALEPQCPAVTAGGSAANTLRAVARLGAVLGGGGGGGGESIDTAAAFGAASSSSASPCSSSASAQSQQKHQAPPLRVAWAPVAGADAQAAFHAAAMASAGVVVLPGCATAAADAATGTVVVATTPDAQRSFLSHVEAAGPLAWDAAALAAAASCRLLLVEGYLWELPGAADAIGRAVEAARSGGALVAFTAGDAGVCERHRGAISAALDRGMADVLFANRAEASALLGGGEKKKERGGGVGGVGGAPLVPADEAAALLASRVGVAIVTDGANGASICALGARTTVPPVWGPRPPVDTNGAGDAFAAGAIFGLLRGYSVVDLGRAGARAAAAVIGRHGAAMSEDEAARVVGAMEAARAEEARGGGWSRRRVLGGGGGGGAGGEGASSASSASSSSVVSPLTTVDEK